MVSVERLEAATIKVAKLVARDPSFAPVFDRLEAELMAARESTSRVTETQRRAEAFLSQMAKPRTNPAMCSSDAPLP